MSKEKKAKLGTESYKGVRDFFPEDMAVQNQIFNIWKKTVEKFGYEEYNASVLEPAELYRAKSGEEIVNEQTYTFTDRGEREVTLRPEMTPTVARMVSAKKREIGLPIRWYSIPNLFRYEQPQRGRLREHYQLNVDLFGVEGIEADVEVIQIAYEIMRAYGLRDTDFEIRLNSRKIMNYITKDVLVLDEDKSYRLAKLIDKKNKITKEVFEMGLTELLGEKSQAFLSILNTKNFEEFTSALQETRSENEGVSDLKKIIGRLTELGITNVVFDQTLMRGFDYYTGTVFEVYDLNPQNKRSVFGGGRYDDLLSLFGEEKVTAVGFGAGDVIARDILESRKLIPKYSSPAKLYVIPKDEKAIPFAEDIAQTSRNSGLNTAIDLTTKKVGDKIKFADKRNIPFIVVIGDNEISTGKLLIKRLSDGAEFECSEDTIGEIIKKSL